MRKNRLIIDFLPDSDSNPAIYIRIFKKKLCMWEKLEIGRWEDL